MMMHVNRHEGLTIAVPEARYIAQIAHRTVLSDDALSPRKDPSEPRP